MKTLSNILLDSSARLDLQVDLPTGDDLATRINYANQSINEAANVAQFKQFNQLLSYLATGATVPLPSNYRELLSEPYDTSLNQYTEVSVDEIFNQDTDAKYCYVLGNPNTGYNLIFNNLPADTQLSIPYQRYPSLMATLSDICELSDPEYVVSKIVAYTYLSRNDERFPQADAEAEQRLKNMVARESKTPSGGINQTKRTGAAAYSL